MKGCSLAYKIRSFIRSDEPAVIALWEKCGLVREWNPPRRDIAEKQKVQAELFLVMKIDGTIMGSVMAAYDGHRGVVNYLAIDPAYQGQGYAKALMNEVEARLKAMGCPKINLMVRTDNLAIRAFYEHQNYELQDCVVLGKWLI